MSLGLRHNYPALYSHVQAALAEGIVVIVAGSNTGQLHGNDIAYPGRYGGVICVGSHGRTGTRSDFSSTGKEVEILAPGEDVESLRAGGGVCTMSGTSMAAPFVAGVVAQLLSFDRKSSGKIENVSQVKTILRRMTPATHTAERGHGVLIPNLLLKYGKTAFYADLND
jgi:subtilisin family serine protease